MRSNRIYNFCDLNLVLVVYTKKMSIPVNFVLSEFESSVVMGVAGTVQTSEIPELDVSATAVFQVTVDEMKAVFKYQTDSNDLTDAAESDIKYFVYSDLWPMLNPANAMMDNANSLNPIAIENGDGPLASNKMLVAHDYVRYLALKLFNTHLGVDLFNNEVALLDNLRLICGDTAEGNTLFDIKASLDKVGGSGTHEDIQGEAGTKYMTNANSSPEKVCRVLFEQLTKTDIARFAEISATETDQPLPFLAGDSINFKLTIAPAEGQEELTGVEAFAPRSYRIRLDLVETAENTVVADDEVSAEP